MLDLQSIRSSLHYEGGVTRRWMLAYSAALASLPLWQRGAWSAAKPVTLPEFPFTLGVASGDPEDQGVVLWTRLAPRPLEPDYGMPAVPVPVRWEIAEDESFKHIVAAGSAVATPQLGHSIHVEVNGLKPDRWYWYRFFCGDAVSPLGRTRTLPSADSSPQELEFAFASCQHYETGLYTAYEHMAQQDLDVVVHLGDYIYEGPGRDGQVRKHVGGELRTLVDYRTRLSQYRSDPLLQGMHGLCPWFVTWDDHECDNNYAAHISEEHHVDPADFLERRANAYQAYYEMMPLRHRSLPHGPQMQLYRRASWGQLAELLVLDTRQYRSDQPNHDEESPLNEAAQHRHNSLLGTTQREWLTASLLNSSATWNVLAQQVMMGMAGFGEGNTPLVYSMDQWPGYLAERTDLMQFLAERRIPNPVVLTGDIHNNWVNDLRVDDRFLDTPIIATEFVGTSISSGGNGVKRTSEHDSIISHNPFVRFHNSERGYVRCRVTPDSWASEYIVVEDVTKPGGKTLRRASFVVEAGRPGAQLG